MGLCVSCASTGKAAKAMVTKASFNVVFMIVLVFDFDFYFVFFVGLHFTS